MITHIVIQTGYAVFGAGDSADAAYAEAQKWMVDESGKTGGMTLQEVVDLVDEGQPGVDGQFDLINNQHRDFDSYLKNQGGFNQTPDGWVSE